MGLQIAKLPETWGTRISKKAKYTTSFKCLETEARPLGFKS